MAALTVGHCCCGKRTSSHHEFTNRTSPRIFILVACQGRRLASNSNPDEKKDMRGGKLINLLKWKVLNGFEKLGKRPEQNLSPKQKGDWKDLFLMSISFALYVYISQKLVCAYCAWTSLPKHLW